MKKAQHKAQYIRIRNASEYKFSRQIYLHGEGDRAYKELKKRFRGRPGAIREAVNIAFMLFAKVARKKNFGPGDAVEEILKLTK